MDGKQKEPSSMKKSWPSKSSVLKVRQLHLRLKVNQNTLHNRPCHHPPYHRPNHPNIH